MLDGINQQALGKIHWGSDIAGVHAACRPDWQVVATSAENDGEDSIQAFEFPDREPVAVSQKVTLKGSTSALWTASTGDSVIAVYRNSQSGDYEAVQINLACGR
jgi:hypothetical protein